MFMIFCQFFFDIGRLYIFMLENVPFLHPHHASPPQEKDLKK